MADELHRDGVYQSQGSAYMKVCEGKGCFPDFCRTMLAVLNMRGVKAWACVAKEFEVLRAYSCLVLKFSTMGSKVSM